MIKSPHNSGDQLEQGKRCTRRHVNFIYKPERRAVARIPALEQQTEANTTGKSRCRKPHLSSHYSGTNEASGSVMQVSVPSKARSSSPVATLPGQVGRKSPPRPHRLSAEHTTLNHKPFPTSSRIRSIATTKARVTKKINHKRKKQLSALMLVTLVLSQKDIREPATSNE